MPSTQPSPQPSTPSASAPPVGALGARLSTLPQAGRGPLFFQVMFGIAAVVALRAIVSRAGLSGGAWVPPSLLMVAAIAGLVLVQRIGRLSVRAVALHEEGVVLVRAAGDEAWGFGELLEVRRDEGPDAQKAFLLRRHDERVLRLRAPPVVDGAAALDAFVAELNRRAGLEWVPSGSRAARRAA